MNDEATSKLILLEMIYFIVFRITTIHETLARQITGWRDSRRTGTSYHIDLYTLEIVYRFLRDRGPLSWNIPDGHVLHPLVSFKRIDCAMQ